MKKFILPIIYITSMIILSSYVSSCSTTNGIVAYKKCDKNGCYMFTN